MIEQGLFQKKIVGRDGFIWWIGQIASDSWKMNIVGSTPDDTPLSEQEGFGYRYQVRIMGYHTADEKALSDNDLPWASVMYPVTAGANAGSSGATPNLRQGNFVYGFFLDGEDAQQPVIMGVLGYNQYTSIYKDSPKIKPFVPFLGYSKAPRNSVRANKALIADLAKGAQPDLKPVSTRISQSGESSASTETVETVTQKSDGKEEKPLENPYSCPKAKKSGVNGVKTTITNLITQVEDAKGGLKNFKKSLISPTWSVINGKQVEIDEYIEIKLQRAAKNISGFISDQIKAVQKWITKKIEAALLKVYSFLFPPLQQQVGDATRTAMDILQCHFRRIINNLVKMIYQTLKGILDKYINIPICAAENIIAAILGKLFGLINGIVSQVVGIIDGILGAVDQALDIVGDVFKFLDDILDFLLCKEEPECPEVEKWATWLGSKPESTTFDPSKLINKIKAFAGTVSDVVDPDNFDFDLDLDLTGDLDIFGNCDTDPVLCGPPRAVFWGGSGSGASGNVIINAIGDIIGVDIVNSGSGYDTTAPFLTFEDDCGNGDGGHGTVVTGPVSEGDPGEWFSDPNGDGIGVIGVTMSDPGFGYLPVANGSQGGGGRTWAGYDQTTVQHPDGTWDEPWDPAELIPVKDGDIIRTPIGTRTLIYCINGKTHEVLGGAKHEVMCDGVLTAPAAEETAVPGGQYPAILYICEVDIIDPGFDYEPGDKVVITPDVGAEITPTFGPFGNLIKLEIVNGGEGFTEVPTIEIQSETGFNAEIRARLCIDRITDELKLPEVQDRVVQVVDCVGKI